MMNEDFFSWIRDHMTDDPTALRLKMSGREGAFDYSSAITQIECRRRFAAKFSETFAADSDFFFPSLLAGEQASSDIAASYHASLVAEGLPVVDLTAGLGIDVFHIARRASEVVAVEIDEQRADALQINSKGMHADNVEVVCGDCTAFIDNCLVSGRRFDVAFIDPARRDADGRRVYALSDCAPDVVSLLPKLRRLCRLLIIKASPMLDIAHTVGELGEGVLSVGVIATPAECKELLVIMDFESTELGEPLIEAVTLRRDGTTTFAFTASQERAASVAPSAEFAAGSFLYEPSPALMKAGAFRLLSERYALSILHPNTRLLYGNECVREFPGSVYKVEEVMPYSSAVIKRFRRKYPVVSVATRNFGISADTLRAKLGVRDGGELRLYGFTDADGKRMLALVSRAD